MNADASPRFSPVRAIGWGLFLASSWTWVIGMWLPVRLMADFGWPAWVAFALPNVLGAMMVGFVLRRREAAAAWRERHAGAMRLFGLWTVLFHIAFLSWFLVNLTAFLPASVQETKAGALLSPAAALWAVGMAWIVSRLRTGGALVTAGLTWLASLTFLVLARGTSDGMAIHAPPAPTNAVWPGLVWSSVSLAFGFLLCPYLDFTILRARLEAPGRTGDGAFALGFGVFFLAMIVGTLLYAWAFTTGWGFNAWIGAHVLVQSIFTMGVHMREGRERGWIFDRARASRATVLAERAAVIGLVLVALSAVDAARTGREGLYYNGFLWAYALAFPAYVWIAGVPRRDGLLRPGVLVGASVILATPAFWFGAVEKHWAFLPLGVAIPLVAPLAAWALPRRAIGGDSAPIEAPS
ncbi:MAG: hypothetical protein ACF8QF_13330 [Phycisphaerales bacterium]